jgi:hypothetical protein
MMYELVWIIINIYIYTSYEPRSILLVIIIIRVLLYTLSRIIICIYNIRERTMHTRVVRIVCIASIIWLFSTSSDESIMLVVIVSAIHTSS